MTSLAYFRRRSNNIHIVPGVNINDNRLGDLADSAAPANEVGDEDFPSDFVEDEDLEEGEGKPYLDLFFGGVTARARQPKAYLAIVTLAPGRFEVAIQGLGHPIIGGLDSGIEQKAWLLKGLGAAIVKRYRHQLDTPEGICGKLVQAEIAAELQASRSYEAVKSNVNKAVNKEWIELPDGRVVPLKTFFRDQHGPLKNKRVHTAALAFLGEYAETELKPFLDRERGSLAKAAYGYKRYLDVQPGTDDGKYQKRLSRLRKGLNELMEKNPGLSPLQLAEEYQDYHGLTEETQNDLETIFRALERSNHGG